MLDKPIPSPPTPPVQEGRLGTGGPFRRRGTSAPRIFSLPPPQTPLHPSLVREGVWNLPSLTREGPGVGFGEERNDKRSRTMTSLFMRLSCRPEREWNVDNPRRQPGSLIDHDFSRQGGFQTRPSCRFLVFHARAFLAPMLTLVIASRRRSNPERRTGSPRRQAPRDDERRFCKPMNQKRSNGVIENHPMRLSPGASIIRKSWPLAASFS
jgi:hypothetical protein